MSGEPGLAVGVWTSASFHEAWSCGPTRRQERPGEQHTRGRACRAIRGFREAPAAAIFAQIADPSLQPAWDGNDNLSRAEAGQRVRRVGEVFVMITTKGHERHNHVVEFEEGRRIACLPSEPGSEPPGHLWRLELRPLDSGSTEVTHTYDWTRLQDQSRLPRARATTADRLKASIDRLAAVLG